MVMKFDGPGAVVVTCMGAHWVRLIILIAQIVEDFDCPNVTTNFTVISDGVMDLADLDYARGQCLSLALRFKLRYHVTGTSD